MSTKNNPCKYISCESLVGKKGAKGYCRGHYGRMRTHGTPDGYRPNITKKRPGKYDIESKETILDRSTVGDGCWIYQGSLTRGYGRITRGGTSLYIHRISYELFIGEIPDGFHIDHLCEVKSCVNPFHLEPVTHAENIRRAAENRNKYGSGYCANGHPWSEYLVRYDSAKNPQRICRKCNTIGSIKSRDKKRRREHEAWEAMQKSLMK